MVTAVADEIRAPRMERLDLPYVLPLYLLQFCESFLQQM